MYIKISYTRPNLLNFEGDFYSLSQEHNVKFPQMITAPHGRYESTMFKTHTLERTQNSIINRIQSPGKGNCTLWSQQIL